MTTTNFEQQLKTWMTEWKARLEDMQVQFNLGKMDAADAFEKQKDNLRNLVTMLKENMDKSTDIAEENANKLKAKLEELQVQLNLGKADSMEAFELQRKKIELALHEVYVSSKSTFNHQFNFMLQLFDNNAQAFKTGLEVVQLQFSLMKMDVKDDADKMRKEMNHKMQEFYSYAEKAQQISKDNIEQLNKQLRDGFEKMNSWMKVWTTKK